MMLSRASSGYFLLYMLCQISFDSAHEVFFDEWERISFALQMHGYVGGGEMGDLGPPPLQELNSGGYEGTLAPGPPSDPSSHFPNTPSELSSCNSDWAHHVIHSTLDPKIPHTKAWLFFSSQPALLPYLSSIGGFPLRPCFLVQNPKGIPVVLLSVFRIPIRNFDRRDTWYLNFLSVWFVHLACARGI